jgi:hypothetical protein
VAARTTSVLLWCWLVLAVALGAFQRMTGPDLSQAWERGWARELGTPRTHGGGGGLRVHVAWAGKGVRGEVSWRRFPTDEPWQALPMARNDEGELEAVIPHQPPAGKVEYRVLLAFVGATVALPAGEAVVARFRAEVPAWLLIPHILAMFTAMLLATRSLLEELRPQARGRDGWCWRRWSCSWSVACSSARRCRSTHSTPGGPAGRWAPT